MGDSLGACDDSPMALTPSICPQIREQKHSAEVKINLDIDDVQHFRIC